MSKKQYTQRDKDAVMNLLNDGKWYTASEIKNATMVTPRSIRQIAEDTALLISGNEGYKRLDKAKQSEIKAHVSNLRSRALHINSRVDHLCENWVNLIEGNVKNERG